LLPADHTVLMIGVVVSSRSPLTVMAIFRWALEKPRDSLSTALLNLHAHPMLPFVPNIVAQWLIEKPWLTIHFGCFCRCVA